MPYYHHRCWESIIYDNAPQRSYSPAPALFWFGEKDVKRRARLVLAFRAYGSGVRVIKPFSETDIIWVFPPV